MTVDSLKALDPNRPIREADIGRLGPNAQIFRPGSEVFRGIPVEIASGGRVESWSRF